MERNGGMAEKEGKKHSMVSRVVLYRRVQLPYRCVRVFPSAEAKRRKIRVAEEKEKQQRDGRSRVDRRRRERRTQLLPKILHNAAVEP